MATAQYCSICFETMLAACYSPCYQKILVCMLHFVCMLPSMCMLPYVCILSDVGMYVPSYRI